MLMKELIHTTLPVDAGHGKLFKEPALKIGLLPPFRAATPGPMLKEKLEQFGGDTRAFASCKTRYQPRPAHRDRHCC